MKPTRSLLHGRCIVNLALATLAACLAATPGSGFPVTIDDAQGVSVTLPRPPQRIVSLAPSLTECLFALDLGPRIVGVTRFCNYPPAAQTKAKVGGYADFSNEKVISLAPELVVGARGNERQSLAQLRRLGVKVFTFDAQTLEQVIECISTLGKLTGQREHAGKIVASFRGIMDSVQTRLGSLSEEQRPKVFFGGYTPPFYTPGKGTFLNDMIRLAGGRNIAADSVVRWPRLGFEQVVAQNPDVVVCAFHRYERVPSDEAAVRARFRERAEWGQVSAVRNKRVYVVDPDVFLRPTPRLRDALRLLAACIHPDKFERAEP